MNKEPTKKEIFYFTSENFIITAPQHSKDILFKPKKAPVFLVLSPDELKNFSNISINELKDLNIGETRLISDTCYISVNHTPNQLVISKISQKSNSGEFFVRISIDDFLIFQKFLQNHITK